MMYILSTLFAELVLILFGLFLGLMWSERGVHTAEYIRNVPCVFNGTHHEYREFVEAMKMIPKPILALFAKHGYSIDCCTPKQFSREQKWEIGLAGLFDPNAKKVYLLSLQGKIRNTLLHEIGHFCDYARCGCVDYCSSTDARLLNEWVLTKKHNAYHVGRYYLSNEAEFLAYIFSNSFSTTDFRKLSPIMQQIGYEYVLAAVELGNYVLQNPNCGV